MTVSSWYSNTNNELTVSNIMMTVSSCVCFSCVCNWHTYRLRNPPVGYEIHCAASAQILSVVGKGRRGGRNLCNNRVIMKLWYLLFSLLKHAPMISWFSSGYVRLPKQLDEPKTEGVKNTIRRFRRSLVADPQLCARHSSSCLCLMYTPYPGTNSNIFGYK